MNIFVLTKARITQVVAVAVGIVAVLKIFDIVNWGDDQTVVFTALISAWLIVAMAVGQHIKPNTAEEPVALGTSLYAAIQTTLYFGVAFEFWHWSVDQIVSIMGLVTVVMALIAGWKVRSVVKAKITPPKEG